ncbi:MAG: hypothetical protein Q9174_000507 [Haloplaca sp. 1 TL-2023]
MPPLRRVSLSENWNFKEVEAPASQWLPVSQFPTNIHLDLMHHGIIPDPYLAKNETAVQWVGEKSWMYKTTVDLPSVLPGQKAVLAFEGLDTHATVYWNDHKLLEVDDMFIPERVDITKHIKPATTNELRIIFHSTYLLGKRLVETDPHHKYGCWNGDSSRLAVRKAQYHYGWDWGPTLMTCGPWRPVYLEVYTSRIADLYFETKVERSLEAADISVACEIEGEASRVRFDISLKDKGLVSAMVEVVDGRASATFKTRRPELWYPARYGRQPLYSLEATLFVEDNICDWKTKRLGIRRAEVVQRGLEGEPGTTFFFQINNIPIFCGGSNWIPADMLIPRIGPSRYRAWIRLAAEGNQSMIRIWGGGIFEEQAFYDACDEFGVLVWQDFLFACGNYPGNRHFLDLVRREAIANVKRLRHHPCIVIWAGNNEDYQYRETEHLDYDPEDSNPSNWLESNFPARYIYEKILPDVLQDLNPGTCYRFGSPFGGETTTDKTVGDIHQWNVWHGNQESYQDWDKLGGRFVAEFGMAAFPSVKTLDNYLLKGKEDSERHPQSSTIDFHHKAVGGERRLATYLVENIPYAHSPLDYYVYCTQLMQAECFATAFRLWKRAWQGPGREYCGGALAWQLDDCYWSTFYPSNADLKGGADSRTATGPTQSWSIVDYHLRPKLAYYTIKREMADFTINMKRVIKEISADKYTRAYIKKVHEVQWFGTNLSLQDRRCYVQIQAWNIISGVITSDKRSDPVILACNRSTEIGKRDFGDDDIGSRTVVVARLIDANDGKIIARSINWPEPLKHVSFPLPKSLEVKIVRDAMDEHSVEVKSDCLVKGFALEADDDDVLFDDNCIDLVPDEKVQIKMKGLEIGQEHRLSVKYLKAGRNL